MKFNKSIILGLLFLSMFGCSQEAMMKKLIPKEEVEFSKKYLSLFQSKDFEEISKRLNPQLKTENLSSQLEQVAKLFPPIPRKMLNWLALAPLRAAISGKQISPFSMGFHHLG